MKLFKYAFFVVLCFASSLQAAVADFVIFSFDRPLQLYALLESTEKYVQGIGQMMVVYRASSKEYQAGYDLVAQRFGAVTFLAQGKNPREDFKILTVQATFNSPSDYVIFGVDDIVVKDWVDLSMCIDLLESTQSYGFYLRLGDHLDSCYTMNKPQRIPALSVVKDDVRIWTFAQGEHDWGYPNTTDMTIYRKKDIESALRGLNYIAPNSLEARWATIAGPVMNKKGLCFKDTKIVNLPLNRVQTEWYNRAMEIDPATLLQEFMQGKKLDIAPLFQIKNKAAHMEYVPTFIAR